MSKTHLIDKPCPFCKEKKLYDFPEQIIYSKWPQGWEGYRLPTKCWGQTCELSGYRTLTEEEIENYKSLGYRIPNK